jgi:hypothetical protein
MNNSRRRRRERESQRATVGEESVKEKATEQQSEIIPRKRKRVRCRKIPKEQQSEVNATERKSKKRVQRSRMHLEAVGDESDNKKASAVSEETERATVGGESDIVPSETKPTMHQEEKEQAEQRVER